MQENFTMIKMSEISLTLMTKMRHVRCKMLSLRKTKSLNTPCSPCVYFGKSPIQRFRQSFYPNTIRIEPIGINRLCLLFIFINRHEINMKQIDTFYLRNTMHSVLTILCIFLFKS